MKCNTIISFLAQIKSWRFCSKYPFYPIIKKYIAGTYIDLVTGRHGGIKAAIPICYLTTSKNGLFHRRLAGDRGMKKGRK